MAISRDKKQDLVAELKSLLENSKGTAFAHYAGLTVAEMQKLRAEAREKNVTIKVVKNRLVRVAMSEVDTYKDTETAALTGQLVYAISSEDEVASAQVLNDFSKNHKTLQLVGGFSAEGLTLSTEEVKSLAALPGKDQLIAEVTAQLLSPVHDTVNALSGNLHGLLDGIEANAA